MTTSRPSLSRWLLAMLPALLALTITAGPAHAATGHALSRSFGTSGAGQLQSVNALVVRPAGDNDVFVVDRAASKVQHFTEGGDYLDTIDLSPQFRLDEGRPAFITADPSSGDIYVAGYEPAPADSGEDPKPRIARYHATGGFVSFLNLSQGGGITDIAGIAADSTGRLYVADTTYVAATDARRNVVQVFSKTGTRTSSFDGSNGPSPFTGLGSLAVDDDDNVFVRDGGVQKFSALGAQFKSIFNANGLDVVTVDPANGDVYAAGGTVDINGVSRYTAAGDHQDRFAEKPNAQITALGVDPATKTVFVGNPAGPSVDVYTAFPGPDVTTTDEPSDITSRSARVAGTVNPLGKATTYSFEYGLDFNFDRKTTDPVEAGSGSNPVDVDAALSGLQPNRTYHYRLKATNDRGSVVGEDRTFSTPAIPPTVSGQTATGVTGTAATLNGIVNPENSSTSSYFEYGPTAGYGSVTEQRPTGGGAADVPISAGLRNLSPNTTYHYRVVANNGVDPQTEGADRTFTTAPPAPSAVVGPAGDSVQFGGAVNTGGLAANVSFAVSGTDNAFSAVTPAQAVPAGDGPQPVSGSLSGLPPGGRFRVQIRVQTAQGTTVSEASSFSSAAAPAPVSPVAPAFDPFPYGCAAPRLSAPAGTLKAGRAVTLRGSDLGVAGIVTFGSRQAIVTRYSSTSLTAVVPFDARGRVRVTVACGRSSNTVIARVSGAAPSNRFSVNTRTRGASALVKVKVPGRGAVSVSGARVGRKTAKPTKAGTVQLKVTLSKTGRAALREAASNRLRTSIVVAYRPSGGTTRTAKRSLVFGGR